LIYHSTPQAKLLDHFHTLFPVVFIVLFY
jgi:hypothetical protein